MFLRLLPLLFIPFVVFAENSPFSEVITEVEKIQAESGFKTASIGFAILPADSEDPESDIAGYHMDAGLVPASTMKLITTATAVEMLGADFQFETELQYSGNIDENGKLTGHVVVKGGGDPTLGSSQIVNTYTKWAAALREAGITEVEGSVVGDATIFGTKIVPDTWAWYDIGNYYGAGASGLNFHRNRVYCTFRLGSVGAPAALVGTDPRLPSIQFINEMKTGPAGSGDQGYMYGFPYTKTFYFRGTLPAGGTHYTIKGSLPDPAFFCVRGFTKHLNQNGIPVSGEPTTIRLLRAEKASLPQNRQTLLTQQSASLGELLVRTNHKSINLRAECIHRMIGVHAGVGPNPEDAAEAVTTFWSDRGIDMTGFQMADGCGLSLANTITPRQLALMLHRARQFDTFDTFYASLPTAGRSGTLKTIGGGSAAEGRIRAKSGTLDHTKNYAGYANARSGRQYIFVIFINNYTGELWKTKSRIVRVWNKIVSL